MQSDAAVRADQMLVSVETEDLHAYIFVRWVPKERVRAWDASRLADIR
jgi:hypothetical protein